jgi:hypothetical protein
MKLLIIQFSLVSYYFLPLRSKYSLQQLVTPPPLNLRLQVSHPYKTTGKTAASYILIFKYLDSILVAFTGVTTFFTHNCISSSTAHNFA